MQVLAAREDIYTKPDQKWPGLDYYHLVLKRGTVLTCISRLSFSVVEYYHHYIFPCRRAKAHLYRVLNHISVSEPFKKPGYQIGPNLYIPILANISHSVKPKRHL